MGNSERLVGAVVRDRADVALGEVRHVLLDDDTAQPIWASVRVSLLGSEVLVPLEDADWDERALRLAVAESTVLAAPPVHDAEAPSSREQERLFVHYGIPSVRLPRNEALLRAVSAVDVCYSVQEQDVRLAS